MICGHLVHFFRFGMLYREKSGNPGPEMYLVAGDEPQDGTVTTYFS
jgi:hypothetical protein